MVRMVILLEASAGLREVATIDQDEVILLTVGNL